jgi:hypothetical protein
MYYTTEKYGINRSSDPPKKLPRRSVRPARQRTGEEN